MQAIPLLPGFTEQGQLEPGTILAARIAAYTCACGDTPVHGGIPGNLAKGSRNKDKLSGGAHEGETVKAVAHL